MTHIHEDGAAKALDAIRAGGEHLIVTIRQRISLALDKLDEGAFPECASYLADALQSTQSLAHAQAYVAIADGSRTMRAADVTVGMTLSNVGEVTEVAIEDCPNENCRRHVTLRVGDHELGFRGDQEVYVAVGSVRDPADE